MVTRVDPATGDHIIQDEWIETKKVKYNIEPGFQRVYTYHLRDIFYSLDSARAICIAFDLLTEEITPDFKLILDYKKLAKLYNYSEVHMRRLIKKMKDCGLIKGSRSIYDVNPFVIIPKNTTNTIAARKQAVWHELNEKGICIPKISVLEANESPSDPLNDEIEEYEEEEEE